jgi:DNA-binding response OmpR family regulator
MRSAELYRGEVSATDVWQVVDKAMLETSTQTCNIVVLDDDEAFLKVVNRLLTLKGYKVITTAQYKDFCEIVQQGRLALVILDVNMPDKDGFEVYTELMTHACLPVLFVTGFPAAFANAPDGVAEIWREQFEAGSTDILYKPFKIDDLYAKVEKLLAQAN